MVLFLAQLRQVDKGVSVPSQVIPQQNRRVCFQGTCSSHEAETLSALLPCRCSVALSTRALDSNIQTHGCHYISELQQMKRKYSLRAGNYIYLHLDDLNS